MVTNNTVDVIARIGEIVYSNHGCLTCLAVGSCIALAIRNDVTGESAMAHIFLPHAPDGLPRVAGAGKYADTAIGEMLERISLGGAGHGRLSAYMAGGARMFPLGNQLHDMDIGGLNADAVATKLGERNIPVRFSDTGGTTARTVRFDVTSGSMSVSAKKGVAMKPRGH